MEKYVLEALFQMGYPDYGIERMKKRYRTMVTDPNYATLFEGWFIGDETFGGGTTNHAWSGGPLTILSQYLCGIESIDPGYGLFQIIPNPGSVKSASATVESVKGTIKSSFENSETNFKLTVSIPDGTEAIIGFPINETNSIMLGNKIIWKEGKLLKNENVGFYSKTYNHLLFKVGSGEFDFNATKNLKP